MHVKNTTDARSFDRRHRFFRRSTRKFSKSRSQIILYRRHSNTHKKTDWTDHFVFEKKGENLCLLLLLSFHTSKRRRRRIMGNQRARSRGLRHGTRNMFTRGFRQNGPKNATTYLRTFRVSDAESENCARVFFFAFRGNVLASKSGRVENRRCGDKRDRVFLDSNRTRVVRAWSDEVARRNGRASIRDGVSRHISFQFSSMENGTRPPARWGFCPPEKSHINARACDAMRSVSSDYSR